MSLKNGIHFIICTADIAFVVVVLQLLLLMMLRLVFSFFAEFTLIVIITQFSAWKYFLTVVTNAPFKLSSTYSSFIYDNFRI